jgi:dipeptidyl aminopeptidase/acylaminoacyl peptidase
MYRRFFSLLVLTLTALTFSMNAQTQNDKMPPLIDREILFGNPEIAGAQISPDGKYIAFIKPFNDVRNVWVKGVDEAFDKAKPLTDEKKRPIGSYFWSQDSKYILFVKDNDGDENFNVYAVNPAESPAKDAAVPAAKNLTNATKVATQIFAVPETEPDFLYIGINERDKAWHDLYKVQISTGQKTLVRENKDRLTGWVFDNKDKLRLATRSTESGETEILKVDGDKFTKIYSCGIFEGCTPIRFNKDDKRVYMETNKGDRDLSQLVLFDPDTQKEELVEQDPQKKVDFGSAVFSELSKEIILTTYNDDKNRLYWKDKNFEADYKWLQGKLPNKEIGLGSSTKDENVWIIAAYSDTEPGETYIFDRKAKKLTLQYKSREKLNRSDLAEMKPVRYKSSDGLEIPAYLTLPKGVKAKNLPLVVVPHGGPWGRDSWGYSALAQFLANRGYAVLQPNFRASTGYGKKFLDSGNLQWGDKMQDDLTFGVDYLVSQGIVDAKRVGILGGSYGGYATLAGVTYTPDKYAAAVAIVAPSNLLTLLKSIPPYWESIRTTFYKRMGDPNTEEGRKQLMRQSPLNSADKIKTPLMVVQGANDPRVNKAEADQIVVALRDRNYPVTYLLADDEGHGFQRPVNNMAMFAEAEKFLAKYLGGRYQETMTDAVAKRLKEITVDVKTVQLAKKADMNSAPTATVTGKWNMSASAGPQVIDIVLDLKQTDANFDGTMSSMLGEGTVQNGKVSGNNFTGTVNVTVQGQSMILQMEGKIDGDKMEGTLSGAGLPLIPFTATKAK